MDINGFKISKFNVHKLPENVRSYTCPLCSHTRKKKTQKCLSIHWSTGLAKCSHCGEIIQLHEYEKKKANEAYKIPEWTNNTKLSEKLVKWLENRKISQFITRLMKVSEGLKDMPSNSGWKKKNTIQFPYYRNGQLINVKYRGADKSFRFDAGCELMPYNIDNAMGQDVIYCVEGEMDVLAVMACGIHNVVSPPNGFTEKGNVNLDWLNNDVEHFIEAKKLILAFDNDVPGENGKKEFIRRFGAHKCHVVDLKDCKDSNEFSIKYGTEELKKALEKHIEIPLEEVSTYNDNKDKVRDFFLNGMPKGLVTGSLKSLDDNFSINLGEAILITGIPGQGKSEVADQMCIGYALNYGHKTAFASPENKPNQLHLQKLMRKLIGDTPRERKDFNDAFVKCEEFCNEKFYQIDLKGSYDLETVLLKAEELVHRKGIRFLVIDPFNKVKYKGNVISVTGNRTNDYTNEYINKIEDFQRKFGVSVILVAHPVKLGKLENGKYQVAGFYDVKGGGEFYDMFPHGLVVYRDYDLGYTLIRTLKVKFIHLGESNKDAWFKYDARNGRLTDIEGDIEEPEGIRILWDEKNWVTKELNNATQKEMYNNEDLSISTEEWYNAKDNNINEEVPF